MDAELQQQENQLRAAGFGEPDIMGWRTEETAKLRAAGFGPEEIQKAWGIPQPPNMDKVRKDVQDRFAKKPVSGIEDALKSGFGMSVSSLAFRNPEHDNVITANADMSERIAYGVGQITGDIPAMILGGLIGGGMGAPSGPGAAVTGAAGAFGLPAGLRATLMDAYDKGQFVDTRDFIGRTMGIVWETLKGEAVGAATAGAGIAAKGATAGAPTALRIAAPTTAELATMVTAGKVLEGELPTYQDFLDGAVLLAGFKGSMKIAGKLRNTYREGALKPGEVADAAARDVTVLQDVVDENTVVPRALENTVKERGGQFDEKSAEEAKDVGTALEKIAKGEIEVSEPSAEVSTEVKPQEKVGEEKVGETFEHGDEGTPRKEEVNPEKATKEIGEQIVKRPEAEAKKLTWDKLYTELKDKTHPFKLIVDRMNELLGRNLPPERDPHILMRLLAGNSGKFKQVVEMNLYDTDTFKNIGPGFETRLEPVMGDIEKFQTYMVAKRALERKALGQEPGIKGESAEAVVREFEEKENGVHLGGEKSTFRKVFDSLNEFQEVVARQFLLKTGIVTEARLQKLLALSRDFIPVHRVYENFLKGNFAHPDDPVPGDTQIVRPLESILRNTYMYVAMGEKNRAGLALVEGMEAVNRFNAGRSFVEDIVGQAVSDVPEVRALRDALPKPGGGLVLRGSPGEPALLEEVPSPKELPAPLRTVQKLYGPEVAEALQPVFEAFTLGEGDKITIFRNGTKITLKAAPEVAQVYHGMDNASMGAMMKLFSAPAAMLRAGVALLPEYAIRNVLVDQPMAGILSRSGYIPFLSALRSIVHVWSKDEVYQRWLKSGGANVALVNMDSRYVESQFSKWAADTNWFKRVWNSVDFNYSEGGMIKGAAATVGDMTYALFTPLRLMSQMSDTLTRLGEMRVADKDQSRRSALQAGYDTREVTQDFLRMGSRYKAFNMITAFANSQFEGVDRVVRSFADRPGATMFKIAGMVMLPSLLLWLNNKDEQWYKDLPDYIRDNYWPFKIGDHIYKVRKPFEVGVLFGSGLERSMDAMFTDNPEAYKGFANSVFQSVTPNMIPTLAQPIVEQITNHSFFNDRKLIPSSLEHVLPEYQYEPYTTETAKALGGMIGFVPNMKQGKFEHMSPLVVENYVREWSGGMGMYALQLMDQALIKAKIVPDPIKPASTLEEMPVIKAFMVRYPSSSTKSIQDFYAHYDQTVMNITTMRLLAKRGNAEAAIRISKLNEDIVKLDGIHTALGNANSLIQTVSYLPDVTPQEKRQLLEKIYMQMTEVGKLGADTTHRINRELKRKETVQ